MKSSLETLEGNKVKLSITLDDAEFDKDVDRAFKTIGREVRLPGFRAGKAPRKVLEARIGMAAARDQALRDGIPNYIAQAVKDEKLDVIAPPEVEVTGGAEDGPVTFDATVELRPQIQLEGYGDLSVTIPNPTVSDDDIEAEIKAERQRHGELVTVDRPVAEGDQVTIDLLGTRDGEPVTGLKAEEWTYEVGQGWITDNFDDELTGQSAGDQLTFTDTPKGLEEPVDFEVTIIRVQENVAPELTDEWVAETLGEDDVASYRESVRTRLADARLGEARQRVIPAVSTALVGLVSEDPPEAMIQGDLRARVDNNVRQLQSRGIDMDQFFQATGQTAETFVAMMRDQTEQAVRLDLALRSVAAAEDLAVGDDELDAEFTALGVRFGQPADAVRKVYDDNGAVENMRHELGKSKAMRWLLDHVTFVDDDGTEIDRTLVVPDDEDLHDHDHDHDGHGHAEHDHDHDDAENDADDESAEREDTTA